MTDVFAFGTLDHWVYLKIILWFFIKPYCLIKPKIQMLDRNRPRSVQLRNDRIENLHDRYRWVLSNILKSDWLIDSTSLDFQQSPRWGNRRQLHLDLWSKIHRLKINKLNYYKWNWAKNFLKNAKIWNGFDNPRDNRSTLDLNYFVSNYNFS